MAANDHSSIKLKTEETVWRPDPWTTSGPVPDHWFDAGRRRRINQFRREMPA